MKLSHLIAITDNPDELIAKLKRLSSNIFFRVYKNYVAILFPMRFVYLQFMTIYLQPAEVHFASAYFKLKVLDEHERAKLDFTNEYRLIRKIEHTPCSKKTIGPNLLLMFGD